MGVHKLFFSLLNEVEVNLKETQLYFLRRKFEFLLLILWMIFVFMSTLVILVRFFIT